MNVSAIPGRDLPSSPASAWTRGGPTRLFFALNSESEARFRPDFNPSLLPGAEVRWLNLKELSGAAWENALRTHNPEVLVTGWNSRRIPEDYLPDDERALRYVCHLTGTVRDIIPRSLIEKGLLVTNWGNAISHTVAEHAMLLVLAALRNMPLWEKYLEDWPRRRSLSTCRLRGKRVGIHGFGAIARELVNMLRPFGARVSAFSGGVPDEFFLQHGVEPAETLKTLFAENDILIECEALTAATEGIVNESLIRLLPPGAVFVNVGRSRIVDEDALARVTTNNLGTFELNRLTMTNNSSATNNQTLSIAGTVSNGLVFVRDSSNVLPTIEFGRGTTNGGRITLSAPITVTDALTITNSAAASTQLTTISGAIANNAGMTFNGSGPATFTLGNGGGFGGRRNRL